MGFYKVTDEQPTDFEAISVYFRVMKGRNNYQSSLRNGIRSKRMAQFDGHSIKFESAEYQMHLGSQQELKQMTSLMPTRLEAPDNHGLRRQQLRNRLTCLKAPDSAYKAINPAIIFNLSLEPALVFNLATFADRGSDDQIVSNRVSFKLRDNVLYLESDRERFELCQCPADASSNGAPARYRMAVVASPLLKDNTYMVKSGVPLPEESLQRVVARDLDWSELLWGEQSLMVRGERITPLKNYKFYPV